jgi:hypothetical protein
MVEVARKERCSTPLSTPLLSSPNRPATPPHFHKLGSKLEISQTTQATWWAIDKHKQDAKYKEMNILL